MLPMHRMLSGVFTTGAAAAAVAAALLLPPGSWQPWETNGIKLSSIRGAGNESSLMHQLILNMEKPSSLDHGLIGMLALPDQYSNGAACNVTTVTMTHGWGLGH